MSKLENEKSNTISTCKVICNTHRLLQLQLAEANVVCLSCLSDFALCLSFGFFRRNECAKMNTCANEPCLDVEGD